MSKLDIVRALYEYNEWADNHVLKAAAQLTSEEFSRQQGASFDSVEGNLAHIVGAQRIWLDRWNAGSNAWSVLDYQSLKGYGDILQEFQTVHMDLRGFVFGLPKGRLSEILRYTDSRGNRHERVLWQLMIHVVNHGTHHRAETAMALAALGQPMRELDYSFFEIERAQKQGARS